MNAIIAPGFSVLAAYVCALRARAAAAEDIAKRRSARRVARLQARIAAGAPVVVTGEVVIRDVVTDAWYHLRPDGTIERLCEYRSVHDFPPPVMSDSDG